MEPNRPENPGTNSPIHTTPNARCRNIFEKSQKIPGRAITDTSTIRIRVPNLSARSHPHHHHRTRRNRNGMRPGRFAKIPLPPEIPDRDRTG